MEKAAKILILILMLVSLFISANRHGRDKTGKHNFWIDLVSCFIYLFLCYLAGLFNNLTNGTKII